MTSEKATTSEKASNLIEQGYQQPVSFFFLSFFLLFFCLLIHVLIFYRKIAFEKDEWNEAINAFEAALRLGRTDAKGWIMNCRAKLRLSESKQKEKESLEINEQKEKRNHSKSNTRIQSLEK